MAKHKRTDSVHRRPRKGRRRNKAQRRSEITSERRHQRNIGRGKAEEKGRQRWFTIADLLDEVDVIDGEFTTRHEFGFPDGHPASPYREAV